MKIETKIFDNRLGSDFPLPCYATDGAAGIDIRACISSTLTLLPQQTTLINSGFAISILDKNYMAILAPRSGLSVKHGIILANTIGIIDSDYQDQIKVALYNRSQNSFVIEPGDRICQLLIVPVVQASLSVVETFSRQTKRGLGGLGSTGKK